MESLREILPEVVSARVPGFLPSRSGFHFPNRFSEAPVAELRLAGLRLPVGNASRGLCGGMVFAARDIFEAGRLPPEAATAPTRGTPLFRYLARRLFSSWGLPFGVLRYGAWSMFPDGDAWVVRGVASRTLRQEWPRVRHEVDAGRLCPLGLVRVRSISPWTMARNHQALAYGYDLDETKGLVHVLVYDPNHPDDDSIRLAFDLRAPPVHREIGYVEGERRVRGFFVTAYMPPSSGMTSEMNSSSRTRPSDGQDTIR
ncbi:hypothetical protein BH20ACT24_BH20ACT24_00680 [soil metagenome]